jgi:O-antigen ligase
MFDSPPARTRPTPAASGGEARRRSGPVQPMMRATGRVDAAARALLAAMLFLFPATVLTVPWLPGVAVAILLAGSLLFVPAGYVQRAELARPGDWVPVLGLAAFLVIGAAGAVAWDAPRWLAINYVRLFAALAIIAAIRVLRPPQWPFFAGCAVGALGAGGFALMQFFWEGAVRASGPDLYFGWQRATIFGGMSVVLGLLPLLAGPSGWPARGKLLLAAGLVGGITAAVLSGSRGAWLAGTVLLVWRVGRAKRGAAVLLLLAIVGTWAAVPFLSERWNAAYLDLVSYEHGRTETALGLRFDMWKAALAAFASHPLVGVGPMGFHDVLAARVHAGLGPVSLGDFEHAHNEFLHALATGGLLSFAGLLAAYWLPFRYFRRAVREGRAPAARAGMALVVTFVILGLSDTLFVHRLPLTVYVVSVAVLLGFAGMRPPAAAQRDAAPAAEHDK